MHILSARTCLGLEMKEMIHFSSMPAVVLSLLPLSCWRGATRGPRLRSWQTTCYGGSTRGTAWPRTPSLGWCTTREASPSQPCPLRRCRPSWVSILLSHHILYFFFTLCFSWFSVSDQTPSYFFPSELKGAVSLHGNKQQFQTWNANLLVLFCVLRSSIVMPLGRH